MPKYADHAEVLALLKKCQEVESDNRTLALEAQWFLEKPDGQWEPDWWEKNSGKPRYTFDMTSPIVDQIAGELEQADFDIKIKPASGNASMETAKLLDGLVRNIENISNAQAVYNHAGRNMVATGIDGWRVVQEFVDADSFDQDLVIKPIYNFTERVWFDIGSQARDRSDSRYCFVLQSIPADDYRERFPKGSAQGVSTERTKSAYYHKADSVVIGQIYYVKEKDRELALLTDGRVIELGDDEKSALDELAQKGVRVENRRKRKRRVVYSRLFDGSDWLTDEQETVFSYIPVIPTYGNFKVVEEKTIYRGVVQKLIDPQRVMNYSLSREIEEGALAPRAKWWMTPAQASGHENKLKTLNTNSDPVQFYNPDPEAPGAPQQNGGAQINPGLRVISESMRQIMGQTAGMFAANMGDNPGLQSGVAIQQLQNKGDTGTIKYFKAQEIAIRHTALILVDAIPRVYDTARQMRILKEDGTFDLKTLNQVVIDGQTGKPVVINDLSQGKYDVTCSAGKAFQNRMQETVATIIEIAQYDPSVLQTSGDILFQNLGAPGMDLIAARKRQQLLMAGAIPESQMTDEEKQMLAAAQAAAGQKSDPASMIAEAELLKAQAEAAKAQTGAQKAELDYQKASADVGLSARREDREDLKLMADIQARDEAFDLQVMQALQKAQSQQMGDLAATIKTMAEALNKIREAMGADAVMSPAAAVSYEQQAVALSQAQRKMPL